MVAGGGGLLLLWSMGEGSYCGCCGRSFGLLWWDMVALARVLSIRGYCVREKTVGGRRVVMAAAAKEVVGVCFTVVFLAGCGRRRRVCGCGCGCGGWNWWNLVGFCFSL